MWQGIHGHDEVVEHFRRTLRAGRLATTYLFVGPEGVGKRAFAFKLAQSLLCIEVDAAELAPCGRCESCRLMTGGGHPDFSIVQVQGSKYLKVEQFIGDRDHRNQIGLCHEISMRPMLGKRKVAIIDDADWFTTEAANCLLKTLEEPPPGAVIILIGMSRSRQLPTILSRSQVIRFGALPAEAVSELSLAEGLAADASAAAQLAERSEGSLVKARELVDAELWNARDRVAAQWRSGQIEPVRLVRDLEEFINAAGKEADARRQRFRQLLNVMGEVFRQSLRDDCASAEQAELSIAALDRCLEAEEQLDRNANQSTLLESWLDDLAAVLSSPQVAAK